MREKRSRWRHLEPYVTSITAGFPHFWALNFTNIHQNFILFSLLTFIYLICKGSNLLSPLKTFILIFTPIMINKSMLIFTYESPVSQILVRYTFWLTFSYFFMKFWMLDYCLLIWEHLPKTSFFAELFQEYKGKNLSDSVALELEWIGCWFLDIKVLLWWDTSNKLIRRRFGRFWFSSECRWRHLISLVFYYY